LRKLTGHIIETHHAYVRREIPRLVAMGAKISAKHGPSKPEVIQIAELYSAMAQELTTHLMKEEQVLFPFIEKMEVAVERQLPIPTACFDTVDRPIANLVAEHDDAGAIFERMRELSKGFLAPEGSCPTLRAYYQGLQEFEQDLHQHVHLENNILFPRAVVMELAASPVKAT
jgi:regulator of cell morphogenesis and NO signaling